MIMLKRLERLEELSSNARFILLIIEEIGPNIAVRQEEIGMYAGMSRSTVIRTMRELVEKGFIETEKEAKVLKCKVLK